MGFLSLWLNQDLINVILKSPIISFNIAVMAPLSSKVGCPSILKAEGHDYITFSTCRLVWWTRSSLCLKEPSWSETKRAVSIHETKHLVPCRILIENQNNGQGQIVLGTGLVEVPEIDTKTNLPILFFTGTTFANQSGCLSVRINLAANNCSTYALISISSSGLNFLAACFTGVKFGPLWSKGVWVVSIHLRKRVRMRSPPSHSSSPPS